MKAVPRGKSRRRGREEELPDPPLMYRVSHERFGRRGRMSMVVMRRAAIREAMIAAAASPLRGSHDILVHQNLMATGEGLDRIQNDGDLQRMRESGELIDFQDSRSLHVNPELPYDRRSARIWTVQFAQDLARQYYERFGEPLIVTSAARSIEYQRHLTHFNGNAAGVEGEAASPHLTGQAIDIGKRGMTRVQLTWMRDQLLPVMQAGRIDVEEEFRQACFHISVYPGYLPGVRELAKMPEPLTTPVPNAPALMAMPQR
jgi:hypothetical protein